MIINGVTFIDDEVKKISLEVFIKQNIDVWWPELTLKKREDRLVSVYNRIVGLNEGGRGN